MEGGDDATFATQVPQRSAMTEEEALKEIEIAQQMLHRMQQRGAELRKAGAGGPASEHGSRR